MAFPNQDKLVKFRVALQLNQTGVKQLEQRVYQVSDYTHSDYGKYLDRDQVLNLVKPPGSVIQYVTGHLGLSGIQCDNHDYYLQCQANLSSAVKYFRMNNDLDHYEVPKVLKPYVVFLEGLTSKRYPRFNNKRNVPSPAADPGYVGREVVMDLFNITESEWCNAQSFAAAEYQASTGYINSDLARGELLNGLPNKTVTANHSIGPNGDYPGDETTLDLQMGALIGANNSVWYIATDQWLWTWATSFFDLDVTPDVVSHSWGWAIDQQCTVNPCNNETSAQYVEQVNQMYLMIAARGVTMTSASGDSGAPGRSDETCDGVNRTVVAAFPGASPWVVSVGATYVVQNNRTVNNATTPLCQQNNCTTGTRQATVNFDAVQWTAGGGFAKYDSETQPDWQHKAVQNYLSQGLPTPRPGLFDPKSRAGPDLAVIGHNCAVVDGGSLTMIDGTSCSSPLFASMVVLLNQHQTSRGKPKLGLAAPLLYSMWYSEPDTFSDITEGNNWCTESLCCPVRGDGGSDYGFLAAKGWDPVTGLGTPNIGKILAWLDKHTK